MLKFFVGMFIGFILGTTYPEETRHLVKIGLKKTVELLKSVTEDVNTRPSYNRQPLNRPNYDEDYKPLYENQGSEQSSF